MKKLKFFWKKWLLINQKIGNFQARIILSILYLIFLLPLALIYRIFSDPLRKKEEVTWTKWEHKVDTIEQARRQY